MCGVITLVVIDKLNYSLEIPSYCLRIGLTSLPPVTLGLIIMQVLKRSSMSLLLSISATNNSTNNFKMIKKQTHNTKLNGIFK